MVELPSIQEIQGVMRWDINDGPRDEQFEENIRLCIPCEFRLDNPQLVMQVRMTVYAVQPLPGRSGVLSFTGGRLWRHGAITLAWGHYEPRNQQGEMWVMPLPDVYTTVVPRRDHTKTAYPGLLPVLI